jgi:hypothetical protein
MSNNLEYLLLRWSHLNSTACKTSFSSCGKYRLMAATDSRFKDAYCIVKHLIEDQPKDIIFWKGKSTFPLTNCRLNSSNWSNKKSAGVLKSISKCRNLNDKRFKFEKLLPIVEITESISSGGTSTRPALSTNKITTFWLLIIQFV